MLNSHLNIEHDKEHKRVLCGKTQVVRTREIDEYRKENDLVLSECDVSVRLSRGAALITRWLDAESKIMVLGTTSSKWPGLSPPE